MGEKHGVGKRAEFLNYLSVILEETEKPNFKQTASHNKTGKVVQQQSDNMLKIKVFDRTKNKAKFFRLPKETSTQLIGAIRNSKSFSGLYFECEWSVFCWIQQWLLHQNQVDLPANLLRRVIETACVLDVPLLLTTCLQFWRGNVRYVMKDGEWELLDENVITQFANLFTNCSLEELTEPELQETLYRHFVKSLVESLPQEQIGHYATFSTAWKCKFCGKVVNAESKSSECQFVAVNPKGDLRWAHSADPDWSLSGLLTKLQGKRKQWRSVYWTLWTYCHFLFCCECLQWFPVSDINRCSYHPKIVYLPEKARSGSYLCCGQHFYRFISAPKRTGCKFKAHNVFLGSAKEQEILRIYHFLEGLKILKESSIICNASPLQMTRWGLEGRNLVPGKYLPIRGKEQKRKTGKNGWAKTRTTAWNQDNQREQEERAIRGIQKFLSGKDEHKPSPQFHGGSYVNVEAEWWSSLQSKMRNITQEK